MTCSSAGLISFDRAQVAQARNMTIDTVAYRSNYKDLYGKKNTFVSVIAYEQERIKGTEKASPIHTLFHR